MSSRRFVHRANFLVMMFFLILGYIVFRMFVLQVVEGNEYREKANMVRFRMEDLLPSRGQILDRNGEILARDTEAISVYCVPRMIENPEDAAQKIAPLLGLNVEETREKFESRKSFVWLKRQVPLHLKENLEKEKIIGIEWNKEYKRYYPHAPHLSHILGFVGIDHQGLEGLEFALNEELTGKMGYMTFERDGTGKEIPGSLVYSNPQSGYNITLTIDRTIQFYVEKALDEAIERTKAKAGVVVVNDPRTGDILAMASRPSYDNNHFNDYPPETWRNLGVSMLFEPGSTIKPLIMASALQENKVYLGESFYCGGSIMVYNHRVRDIKSHGQETLEDILVNSCNVGTIQIAQRLGEETLYRYLKNFGIGESCEIGLNGEEIGLLRKPRSWSALSIGAIPIGQEMLVTPIQLLRSLSTVANRGVLMKTRLVKKVTHENGQVVREVLPSPIRRVIDEGTADLVLKMMKKVVDQGTGKKAAIPGYAIAGKTGTGQKIGEDGRYAINRFYSSFVGFFPVPEPHFGILVVLDEAQGEYYGGDIAAPVFREIVQNIIHYAGIMPENAEVTVY
ncbi:MAG: penicillin-binding protein 2 [Candidatus Atribacteria bacterium]|nr:penicillin-binding protein 2 [Candidatus Atribacteria bacterium]